MTMIHTGEVLIIPDEIARNWKAGQFIGPGFRPEDRMRHFEGGAVRDNVEGKLEWRGFLDWGVLQAFGRYMGRHRHTAEGLRDWDNWKAGMPKEVWASSLLRHVLDVVMIVNREGEPTAQDIEEALGGIFFNAQGLWRLTRQERANETGPAPCSDPWPDPTGINDYGLGTDPGRGESHERERSR